MSSNININNHGSIGYHGSITVQVKSTGHTLATYQYHNAGLPHFFKELCMFLTGNGSAKDLLPTSIALYTLNVEETQLDNYLSENVSWETLWQEGVISRVSPQAALDVTTVEENATGGTTAVFQVSLPYSEFLNVSQKVYLMALYPRRFNIENPYKYALAFYKLKNAASWQPIEVTKAQTDLNLLIEWRMEFSNS